MPSFPVLRICRSQPASAGFVSVAGSLQGPAGARDMLSPGSKSHLERAGARTRMPPTRLLSWALLCLTAAAAPAGGAEPAADLPVVGSEAPSFALPVYN